MIEEVAAAQVVAVAPVAPVALVAPTRHVILQDIPLTQGNIDNHHIYLRDVISDLPAACIGGSNRRSAAPESLVTDYGHSEPVVTDIDGTKKIFRSRGWVQTFFANARARPGDRVRIVMEGPRRLEVSVVKGA